MLPPRSSLPKGYSPSAMAMIARRSFAPALRLHPVSIGSRWSSPSACCWPRTVASPPPRGPANSNCLHGVRPTSSSSSSSAPIDTQTVGTKEIAAIIATICGLVGTIAWAIQPGEEVALDLKPISEEMFEWADNLFVFFLDGTHELFERQNEIQHVMKVLAEQDSLGRLLFLYNVAKEGDPPLPDPQPTASEGDAPRTLRAMMYKGQRKNLMRISTTDPSEQLGDVVRFFTPVAEDLRLARLPPNLDVSRVSRVTFDQDVVQSSSPTQPMLLQMYEDTCFLCFLMRPFINSLAKHLADNAIPLRIVRLNLERNDFPDQCPVARGTPTFVLFRGPDFAPAKWDEFKPHDLVEKLRKEFPDFAEEVYSHMDELQKLVSNRLQLFTQVVMWNMELQKLERLYTSNSSVSFHELASEDSTEEVSFGTVVTEMMLKDMKRHDKMNENLQHLQREVDELEHDALLMGDLLAQSIMRRERAQQLVC